MQYVERYTNYGTFSPFSNFAYILSLLYVLLDSHCSSEILVRPGMNRCNISEEETTKSLYALYQIPISEGQNNMQSHVTEPKIGVKSIDTLQLFHVDKKSSSDVMLDRGNKKHGIHEKAKPGLNIDRHQLSNTVKNGQESNVKNRSLNDMNQRSANSNRMKKSNSQNLNRLNNFKEDKKALKAKEYQINGGISLTLGLIYFVAASYLFYGANKEYVNVVVKCVQVTNRLD